MFNYNDYKRSMLLHRTNVLWEMYTVAQVQIVSDVKQMKAADR
jgi:hypothetical protein